MKFSVKVEGGIELAKTLNVLSTRVRKRVIREGLERAGEPIRAGMASRAPRAPGAPDLADMMVMSTARMEGIIDNDHAAAIKIGPAKERAHIGYWQEHGTIHHGAQPFARPAFEAGWQKALADLGKHFWTALAAVGVSRTVSRPSSIDSGGGDVL